MCIRLVAGLSSLSKVVYSIGLSAFSAEVTVVVHTARSSMGYSLINYRQSTSHFLCVKSIILLIFNEFIYHSLS